MTLDVETIQVSTKSHSYQVVVGSDCLLSCLDRMLSEHRHSKCIAIIDEILKDTIALPPNIHSIYIPGCEDHKTRESKSLLEDELLALKGVDKNIFLLAIGGGSVGDLVGFTAATLLRGVRFIQVPTTLLAMVDASVGGKTAVNTRTAKNMSGAFHQPVGVIVDLKFLETLSRCLIANGMAEIIKAGFVGDPALWDLLLSSSTSNCLKELVIKAIKYKARIVQEDEKDSGVRNQLNFGHTIGHAIEMMPGNDMLHGECVAIGMVYELLCLRAVGVLEDSGDINRLISCLERFGLPTNMPKHMLSWEKNFDEFQHLLLMDKKVGLVQSIGEVKVPVVAVMRIGETIGATRTIGIPLHTVMRIVSPFVTVTRELGQKVSGHVVLPGSKSVANRALLLAAMAGRPVRLSNVPESADVCIMRHALAALGYTVVGVGKSVFEISPPLADITSPVSKCFVGNSGTSARFLLPFAAWLVSRNPERKIEFTCEPRMEDRPVKDLLDSLKQLFPQLVVECWAKVDSFPLTLGWKKVEDTRTLPVKEITVQGSLSSQFVSGLLMTAPLLGRPLTIRVLRKIVSQPFIDMTVRLMEIFHVSGGVTASQDGDEYCLQGRGYEGPVNAQYSIPGDAAGASYPLAIAAVTGGEISVNVVNDGLQKDFAFTQVLESLGCRVEFLVNSTRVTGPSELFPITTPVDFNCMTDTFLTGAMVMAVSGGKGQITGIANQRVKECDRIMAVVAALNRMGYKSEETEDGLTIFGDQSIMSEQPVYMPTFNDHRVAMSLSVLAMQHPGILFENPRCVEKTYPDFFDMLERDLGLTVRGACQGETKLSFATVIIGMRGIGKTTVGRWVSESIGSEFIDLDEWLQEAVGRPINEIITTHGWEEFRKKETQLLKEIVFRAERETRNVIVSTGGGIGESPAARDLLKLVNTVVWLRASDELTVTAAVKASAQSGVPQYVDSVKATYLKRKGWYEECSTIDVFTDRATDSPQRLLSHILDNRGLEAYLCDGSKFVCLTSSGYADWTEEMFGKAVDGPGVEAVELRIDLVSDLDHFFHSFSQIRMRVNKPVILTLRSKEEGGEFIGDDHQYQQIVRQLIRMQPEFVDVEVARVAGDWLDAVDLGRTKLIASVHSKERPEERRVGEAVRVVLRPRWAQVGKVVFHAETLKDSITLTSIAIKARESKNNEKVLIAVCTGAGGIVSRAANPVLTPVCVIDRKRLSAAAPGQIDAVQLENLRDSSLAFFNNKFSFHLFGHPIDKSPSPYIHNLMFAMRGLSEVCQYSARRASSVDEIIFCAKTKSFRGASVTIPLKEKVFDFLMDSADCEMSEEARMAGAVNTLSVTDLGKLRGDNTDLVALKEIIKKIDGFESKRVLVVGTGGAARGALVAATALCSDVSIAGRDEEKVSKLCEEFRAKFFEKNERENPEIVIACIPSAGQSEFLPSTAGWDWKAITLIEMAYIPRLTPLVSKCKESGGRILLGEEVLLLQAMEQHKVWIDALRLRGELMDLRIGSEIDFAVVRPFLEQFSSRFLM